MPSTELWKNSLYSALFLLHVHVCAHMCGGQRSASGIMPAQALPTFSLAWYLPFIPGCRLANSSHLTISASLSLGSQAHTKVPNFLCMKQTLDGPSYLFSPYMFLLAYLTLHCHLFVYIFCHLRLSHPAVEAWVLILALFFMVSHMTRSISRRSVFFE